MKRFLKSFQYGEKGFTLIELLVALAITGIITGGITTTIFQVFNTNLRCSNHMVAVRQVQNAGYWFSRDAQMAQIVELTEPPEENPVGTRFPVTLTWTDWETNEKHKVTYSLEKIGEGPWQLKRSHSINGGQPSETIVAQYIDSDPNNTNCGIAAGSAFNLPDSNDAFTITGGAVADNGTITVTAGSISVATTGTTATYNAGTGAWTTPSAGDTIVVAAAAANTRGNWTSATGTATATITVDSDGDATLAGGVLVLTVTAKVGEGSETRIYEVSPRPIMY